MSVPNILQPRLFREPNWTETTIEEVLAPLHDGRKLHQGWSPQCEKEASSSEETWGVLKTTSVQPYHYQAEHNKALPSDLAPKPGIEVQEGDILLTNAGPRARCGVACLVKSTRRRLMFSGKIYRFRADDERISPEFLGYYLQTGKAQEDIDRMKTGISDSGLNLTRERFLALKIPLLPRHLQDDVVADIETQLSRIEAGVVGLRRAAANLKRYRAAVLKAACEGRLVPTEAELAHAEDREYESGAQLLDRISEERRATWKGRGKYKEAKAAFTDDLKDLPEGWSLASVEQISSKVVDGVHKKPDYVLQGIPFVTVRNLTAGTGISLERLSYVTEEDHAEFIKRADPERGDVLVSKDGTLGVVRVIEIDTVFSIFVSVALIKPVERSMGRFLGHALSSPQVQQQMVPKGTGLQHIHLEDLREDCIPLPPLAEQVRIVAEVERRLSVVDELEATVAAGLRRAVRLRQAVLARAFSPGEA